MPKWHVELWVAVDLVWQVGMCYSVWYGHTGHNGCDGVKWL